jgi:hypothetical protein
LAVFCVPDFIVWISCHIRINKMADTRNDVTVPVGVWVDLYAAAGITVGVSCSVTNKGVKPVYIVIAATAPATPVGTPKGIPLYPTDSSNTAMVPGASTGLWAYSPAYIGAVLVQE